jgi:hypothetical protein
MLSHVPLLDLYFRGDQFESCEPFVDLQFWFRVSAVRVLFRAVHPPQLMSSVVLFRQSHSGTFKLAAWAAEFKNNVEAKGVCARVCSLVCKHKFEKFWGATHCHHVTHLLPPALDPCDNTNTTFGNDITTNLHTIEYKHHNDVISQRETESWYTEH